MLEKRGQPRFFCTFVSNVTNRKMCNKPTGSLISYFSNLVKTEGGINLAQGIPGFQPPSELTNALAKFATQNVHQYAPGIGNTKLLDLLSQVYSVSVNNLLIIQGATEGLSLVYTLALQKYGSNFSTLAFSPAYECYSQLPRIFGQNYVNFAIDKLQNDFDELISVIQNNRVKLVFLASPGNPHGRIHSKGEVERLLNLAEEFDFYLILDMVYKDLYFENPPFTPPIAQSDNLFYVNSFSKKLCITGWRLGYIISSAKRMVELRAIHDYIGLCAPSVLQESLAFYLANNGNGQQYISELRTGVLQNFNLSCIQLEKIGFTIPQTGGGCFIWAQLPPKHNDGFKFALELYKSHRVAIIPGEHFDPNCSNRVRINIARERDEVLLGLRGIEEFIANRTS